MKLRKFLALGMAMMSVSMFAQTHVEGEEYYKADQLDNAKDLLLRSLKNPSTDKAVSNYYLGMISIEENKINEAKNYFNAGVSLNPQYPYNYVGLGLLQLMSGDAKGAEGYFKEADKFSKKDASLQIAIARAYDRVDPMLYAKQITKQVEKARKFSLNNPDIYIFEGDRAKDQKNYGEAGGMYEMAASYDQTASPAYVKYANLYTMVNPDYAIKMLQQLLQNNPNSALGQRELANAYYNKQDYANAAKYYGKYVENPSHFKSDENRYAFLLFYGGDYKKGFDYATKLLKDNPSDFTAQRYQFMNAAQLPEMASSLLPMAEALYAAHKANPKANTFAPIDITLISSEFTNAKMYDKAIEVLKEGISEMPTFADFNKSLALTYVETNNLTEATKAFEAYLAKIDPGYNDYIQAATFAFYAGVENKANKAVADQYYEVARSNADKAKAILPDNYRPVKFYGDIARQQAADKAAADKAAVPFYEEAVTLLENSADPSRYARDAKEMYMYLGNYWVNQKNESKAKAYFNNYLKYDPDNAEVRKFANSLK